jgi:branched-chain amino acid transport system permease protein
MSFFVALLVDGALAGAVYALVALAFVVVYKASRVINFALGEWVMFASRMVASGSHAMGLGLVGAVGLGCAGMMVLAVVFNRVILRPLVGQPAISLIMVTIGFGAFLRASAVFLFPGVPGSIALPIPPEPWFIAGVLLSPGKLIAAAAASVCVALVTWVYRTRTGVALRAIADDPQAAMAAGVDIDRHFAITWAMAGTIATVAGTLWMSISGGGGFSLVLVGLKVFPIVIIGGLDSVPGTILGALFVGVLESETAGYLDPLLGAGFSSVASYVVLLAMPMVRPYGLLGSPDIKRV